MLVFLVVIIVVGAILEIFSLKDNLSNIQYTSVPSKLGCEPDEVFQIKTTITNYGSKRIPYLKIEEEFPKDIVLLKGEKVQGSNHNCIHTSALYVKGRQKITRTLEASLPSRGLYFLEGCRLLGGDFLGIRENDKEIKQSEEIIIFPKVLQNDRVLHALSGYYGDFSVQRLFIEDPLLINSYKDYSGREPMRSISWMQSAKKNRLTVKEFDHTMDLSVTILLDVYLHWSEGVYKEELEYCYSLVRTIAEFLEQKKVSYRLLTNTYIRSGNTLYEVLEKSGQGAHHFTMLLYTLGQADSNTFCDTDGLFDSAVKNFNGENTFFYVAPFENEKRSNMVKNLESRLGSQVYPMYASALQEVEEDVN